MHRGNLAATYLWIGYGAVQVRLGHMMLTNPRIDESWLNLGLKEGLDRSALTDLDMTCHAMTHLHTSTNATPQFPVYEAIKDRLGPSSTGVFWAGGTAGLVATVATYPLDVIRTQFAAQGIPRVRAFIYINVRVWRCECWWFGLRWAVGGWMGWVGLVGLLAGWLNGLVVECRGSAQRLTN
jgi:hypothetical protein